MNMAVTNWGWSASWFGNGVDFDQNWSSLRGFSVEFDGDIDTFIASGAREGNVEVEGDVGTMLLGFPRSVGSGITPGMENFSLEVEGDLGYLGATRLFNVDIEVDGDLGDARLSRSSSVDLYVGGDTGNISLAYTFDINVDFEGDVGTYRSVESFFNDVNIGGEIDLLVDRGGLMNSYSVDTVDVARFIGGGFNFLSADELDQSLLVHDSVASTFHIGETDDGARIRLVRGENNYLEVAEAGDKLVVTVIGGQNNTIRVGDGDVRYNLHLTEQAATENPNITIIGGDGDETFNIRGYKNGGMADVEGGDGNDTFIFRAGTASVHAHGGEGHDSFLYQGGNVTIEDYTAGVDKLTIDFDDPIFMSFYDNGNGTMTVHLTDYGLLG